MSPLSDDVQGVTGHRKMDGFIQGAADIGFSTMHSVIRPPIESTLERRVPPNPATKNSLHPG